MSASRFPSAGEAAPPDRRQPQFGQRHSRVRARQGAPVEYAPLTVPDLRIERERLEHARRPRRRVPSSSPSPRSRTSPASSIRSTSSSGACARMGRPARRRRVRADEPSRLSAVKPDFVSVSFYKMFGYPTGVGCLLARTRASARCGGPGSPAARLISRPSGPRSAFSSRRSGLRRRHAELSAIPAVEIGLRHSSGPAWSDQYACPLPDGVAAAASREPSTQQWPSHGPHLRADHDQPRGGTIDDELLRPRGPLAGLPPRGGTGRCAGISLRTGCFCNPGAGETAEGITEDDILKGAETLGRSLTMPNFLKLMRELGSGKSVGAIRVSFRHCQQLRRRPAFCRFRRNASGPVTPGDRGSLVRHRFLPGHSRC